MGDIPQKIMQIGTRLLIKHEGKVTEGIVMKLYEETIEIKIGNNELVIRKFWEVRKIDEK